MRPLITLSLVLALAPGAPLSAQFVQPLPQAGVTTDADALAEQVRALAVNPSDLNALIRAGELALKLEDPTAAAAFFARADRIDPRNPRVKAGTGVLLVQQERPGEALRRFDEAERYGGRPATFAADRGLAYDLIGEQERAQRDYRLALKAGPNDETTRRYALSLGIAGKREEALALLDPLLRKSDRGAWRARAFILAMNGDHTDADKIATTMMPAGLSQGLQPFFDRLATLSPVDRAFAVHFGETRASQQRLADARQVPALPPLGADPDARELAAAAARAKPMRVEVAKVEKPEKPAKRKRGQREPVQLAVQSAAPPVAMALPTPPAYVDPAAAARSTATPGTTGYYVQQLPPRRATVPTYTQATSVDRVARTANDGPVAQANLAAAAAAAPVTQPQAAPVYQPVQRVSGRVMPLAPLQPAPLPGVLAAQTRSPGASLVGGAFPAQIQSTAAPAMTTAAPPAESATRVVPATPSAATVPTPVMTAPVAQPSAAATTTATRVETVPVPTPTVPAETITVVAPTALAIATVPLPASQPEPARIAPVVARPVERVEEVRKAETVVESKRAPVARAAAEPVERPRTRAHLTARTAQDGKATTEPDATETDGRKATTRKSLATKKAAEPDAEAETKKPLSRRAAAAKKAEEAEADSAEPKTPSSRKAAAAKKAVEDAEADAAETKQTSTRKGAVKKTADADEAATDTKSTRGRKRADMKADLAADTEAPADKKGTRKGARKDAAATENADDDKSTRGKKGTNRKSTDDKKVDAKKSAKSAEPARVWVQVSGGANENDLPKQWNKLRTDKPEMFKGRAGYSTPLRATNRILTGPFASEAEAQAYVNKLAGKGLSGFLFKSEPGQKINKLPAK